MNNNTTKNMKYLMILVLGILAINVYSQKMAVIDTTRIKCSYEYKHMIDTIKGIEEEDLIYLQIGNHCSKSFSYYTNQFDSIEATPNGKKDCMKAAVKALSKGLKGIDFTNSFPHRRLSSYVFKNHPQGKMAIIDNILDQYYIYEDKSDLFEWELADSGTRNILGHECQMASCNFRGRYWTAWYALDIPINDGPWKFRGLPGLVMEVYDSENQHHFCINGIQQTDGEPIYIGVIGKDPKNIQKTSQQRFLKSDYDFLRNGNYTEAQTGISIGTSDYTPRFDYLER